LTDGKAKGDRFENEVCRALSVWLVPGDWQKAHVFTLPFRRRFTDVTPLDGHWAGQGDILHKPGIKFPFCVECKKHEGWELDGMLGNDKWPPWSWWTQAKAQALTANMIPLMFFTRNRRKVYVLMEEEIQKWLRVEPHSGPMLAISQSNGASLALALMDDLVRVQRTRISALSSRRERSRNTSRT